jgi:Pilus assembly protein, PilO
MIANLSGRLAALIAVAVVLVVLLVGWALLVSPERSKAAELNGKIDQTHAQIDSTQAYVKNPATRSNVRQLARLRTILPDDARMSQILRQLSAAAGVARVSLNGITPQAGVAAGGAQALPISLTVEGHYSGLSKFLNVLRTKAVVRGSSVRGTGRLYAVDGIQFTSGGSSSADATDTITATISLSAFVFGTSVPVTPSTTTDSAATPATSP